MEKILRSAFVGAVTVLLTTAPLMVVRLVHRREFVYMQDLDEQVIMKKLRWWRILDIMFWIIGTVFLLFFVIFVVAFLANVAEVDQMDWLVSAASSLCVSQGVVPVMLSPLYASLAGLLAAYSKLVRYSRAKQRASW